MRIKHQVDINATETFEAKLTFEMEAQIQGMEIKGYHTANGIFSALEFMEELLKNQKKIRFSGENDSHQNGASERAIKTVVTMPRNILMHAALRCPDDTCPLIFGQWQWIILYGSTIGYLICSIDHLLL